MSIESRLNKLEAATWRIQPGKSDDDPYFAWTMKLIDIVYETDDDAELKQKLEKHGAAPEPTTRRGEESRQSARKGWGDDRPELRCILTAKNPYGGADALP